MKTALEALTVKIQQDQWKTEDRHLALHLATQKKAELLSDLAELDAITLGHHLALQAEESKANLVAAVTGMLDRLGFSVTVKESEAQPASQWGHVFCPHCNQPFNPLHSPNGQCPKQCKPAKAQQCQQWCGQLSCTSLADCARSRMDDAEGQGRR